jgi:hypothetical protein
MAINTRLKVNIFNHISIFLATQLKTKYTNLTILTLFFSFFWFWFWC